MAKCIYNPIAWAVNVFSANTKLHTAYNYWLTLWVMRLERHSVTKFETWPVVCILAWKLLLSGTLKFQVRKYAEKSYLWWKVRSLEKLMQHHGKPLPCHQNLNWSLLVWINVQLLSWSPSNPAPKENPCWFLFNKYNPFQAVKMFCTVYVETACTFLQSQVLIQGTQSWDKVFCLHISIMTTLSVQK